ncbi:Isoleucyl-tRNA synthetase [Frankia casuarinae]|uniref:Isoleucine--tRNA ligase n=2 Tax=Frankia casuarinae (strain DSM 45818 / CECT 9043 / HFP020203 / CcI3) TaxID=106370 RepID=Q2JD41_FRACC|nr:MULTISPECIES: isoleucine--tRNA ligase [Frankia]ABD10801.1 Isoleucyl-tRNA synthetase [Frankia casuarinae]ETA03064.1 Isoleucyl-tRNA synthetase [Frankia sp. CcI6]EYT92925.1 Isoleucyl-tRNA synthetase [Frankia casuarinae]KDA44032.1 Isoleucyl-tRNA synthetase [Frankia sp. BMG5.23]OHV57900.1 isoleucine--tRNA ligase [Frankia sp. CgIS1]
MSTPLRHPTFAPLPAQVDLPALERETLARWRDTKVFHRSLEATADRPLWVFYEGPPTANGRPGAHHVEARVFKDLFPRYRTMKGYHVPRRAGWDCHGLPVELAVEKELGFTSKNDIEAFGIAEFNARCRESVLRHVADFSAMTERMGYWVDLDGAYRTMDTSYVESVWWSLKQIFDQGLLVEDFRVTPYCPRDETPLSDHEVSQGYSDVDDPSVYVRFPLVADALGLAGQGAQLLVWTTTPWTLVSNTAVAVHPEVEYVLARAGDGELFVVAEPLVTAALGEDAEIVERFRGAELAGARYTRPFELLAAERFAAGTGVPHSVVLADYVTTTDGTGLVHQAPAFGAEDLAVCRASGLPVVNPIGTDGRFLADVPLVGGMFFKDADAPLTADLRERGRLWRASTYTHSYPHCWRCHTPLIYYPLPSWYIRTTAIRDELLAQNERTTWHPERIKTGRYGEWLRGNVDWALSRNRYWGTPLPVWRCDDDPTHLVCVGSLAELSELAGRNLADLDPHRPFVDEVTGTCPTCGGASHRVPEVIDVWYDSGAMPFAQWGAPHHNLAAFTRQYPAQYICEAIDQTRGWFYTMMAVGTLVFGRSSYETVLCLGLLLDADGRKMSKHLGNVLDPFELFERHGADAVRWLMLAGGSPWADRRVSHEAIEDIVRKVLLTYWNTSSFFALYAGAAGWRPGADPAADPRATPPARRHVLDRWALSELAATVAEVDDALENFDSLRAGRRIARFVDDLSNWYVRRSRRRFWAGDADALSTLHTCLDALTRVMAPFTPFLTDWLWSRLFADASPRTPDSVHLAAWPELPAGLHTPELSEQMDLVRRIVELGRAARAASGVRTRQPLPRAVVGASAFDELSPELIAQITEELNVTTVEPATSEVVDISVKPNFRALGRRFGRNTKAAAAAIAAAGPPVNGRLTVTVDGEDVELSGDELIITETPRQGWAVTAESGLSVALDLEISPQLARAGLARDVVRVLQDARKAAGLEITDRVDVSWAATREETALALRTHGQTVAEEVLAVSFTEAARTELPAAQPRETAARSAAEELGLAFTLTRHETTGG